MIRQKEPTALAQPIDTPNADVPDASSPIHVNPLSTIERRWWRAAHCVELVATFVLFAGVMHFLYAGNRNAAVENIGAPGHDSFYHIKMAALLPEIGLVDSFPWLRTTIFNESFVDHHYGFHWLMSPFVRLSYRLTGDYAAGGRWFITLSFGLSMVLFNLLLMVKRIEHRWIWMALCILLPSQFFGRHIFVRAISPSLVCMFALCLCMFTRHYIATAVVAAASIHVYLGAVTYVPVLVVATVVAGLIGLVGDLLNSDANRAEIRSRIVAFDGWRLAGWALAGWIVGLLTHPYGPLDVLGFLKLQVFGSGLTPDIPVGREWKSYSPAWFFANMSGITLIATATALCLRLRLGNRLSTDELAVLIISFVFLGLTFKARRFIEYWPVFSILSAAYLAGPLFSRGESASDDPSPPLGRSLIPTAVACVFAIVACIAAARLVATYVPDAFANEWRWWTLLAGVFTLVPIVRATPRRRSRWSSGVAALIGGTAYCVLVAVLMYSLQNKPNGAAALQCPWWTFVGLAFCYFLGGALGAGGRRHPVRTPSDALPRNAVNIVAAVAITAAVIVPAGSVFAKVQKSSTCNYDLPAIRKLMEVLKADSQRGDVVFTDDWDIFPVYFYFNDKNDYIVGLDPKFSQAKDPVLWERYVRISRGETPATRRVTVVRNGKRSAKKINVRLSDIRDFFDARYVIVDQDHTALANKLNAHPRLAKRIYPKDILKGQKPPYMLYRVLNQPRPKDESITHGSR